MIAMFSICALLPLVAFAWLALRQASEQLRDATETELHRGAKSAGMSLAARLIGMDANLKLARAVLLDNAGNPDFVRDRLGAELRARFAALWVQRGAEAEAIFGERRMPLSELSPGQLDHLAAGDCLMVVHASPRSAPVITLARQLDDGGLVAAEADDGYLFDPEDLRSSGAQVLVYSGDLEYLSGPAGEPADADALRTAIGRRSSSGTFAWTLGGEDHIGCYWRLFLRPRFGTDLLLVQSSASARVLAPLRGFQWLLTCTAVIMLLLVTLTGMLQIRRMLTPIAELERATQRVASGDMRHPVTYDGDDELGALARAFNSMTAQLRENIARREATERELVAARDAALAAARAKAEFLTNVSHELRTPLTSILVYSELLADVDGADEAQQREFLDIIDDQARHLHLLVENVLDLSAGGGAELLPVDPLAAVRTAVGALPGDAQARVTVSAPAGSVCVAGDHDRLVQLWRHVLDNALKFSPPGAPIEVVASVADAGVIVAITDHGCGIAADDLQRVFEPFCQVGRDQLTDKSPGVGLGLTLAKNIVDHHGGRIGLDSALGRGTTVRVVLPLFPVHVEARPGGGVADPRAVLA